MQAYANVSVNVDGNGCVRTTSFSSVRRLFRLMLVIVFLFGIHTRFTLFLNRNIYVPFLFSGVSGLLLFIGNLKRIRASHLTPIFGIIAVAATSIIFVPEMPLFFVERLKAFSYFIYSILVAYSLYLELSGWRRTQVSNFLMGSIVVLMIGTFLENYTGFGHLSDAFRQYVFPFVYEANIRDLLEHGGIRPKLFTAEPSWLAGSYLLVSTSWLIVSKRRRKFVVYFILLGVMLFLVRSPILFLGMTNAIPAYLLYIKPKRIRRGRFGFQGIMLIGVALLFCAVLSYFILTNFLYGRMEATISGQDKSIALRLLAPAAIAYTTIKKYPFFGAGIGGKEAIADSIMLSTFLEYKVNTKRILFGAGIAHTMANSFWEYWTVFGVLGGGLGIFFILQLMRKLGCKGSGLAFSLLIISYSFSTGAVGGVWIWSSIFITLLAIRQSTYELCTVPHRSFLERIACSFQNESCQ